MLKRSLVKLSAALALSALSFASQAVDITGAGATFPFPIYAKWAADYKAATGRAVNYQSIGSGGGARPGCCSTAITTHMSVSQARGYSSKSGYFTIHRPFVCCFQSAQRTAWTMSFSFTVHLPFFSSPSGFA